MKRTEKPLKRSAFSRSGSPRSIGADSSGPDIPPTIRIDPVAETHTTRRERISDRPVGTESRNSRLFAIPETELEETRYTQNSMPPPEDRFQTRIKQGKVRLCGLCGDIMTRSTRMILSPGYAVALVLVGILSMAGYGVATNFYETPWFLKFILPAAYYMGSIFIGLGIVFFFLRERVWKCQACGELSKR